VVAGATPLRRIVEPEDQLGLGEDAPCPVHDDLASDDASSISPVRVTRTPRRPILWPLGAHARRMSRCLWVLGDGPTGSAAAIVGLGCDSRRHLGKRRSGIEQLIEGDELPAARTAATHTCTTHEGVAALAVLLAEQPLAAARALVDGGVLAAPRRRQLGDSGLGLVTAAPRRDPAAVRAGLSWPARRQRFAADRTTCRYPNVTRRHGRAPRPRPLPPAWRPRRAPL
jgi:hypothetical protein